MTDLALVSVALALLALIRACAHGDTPGKWIAEEKNEARVDRRG